MVLQGVSADSVRRAVGEVFARPEFRWEPRRYALHWLGDAWRRFEAWIDGFGDRHPLLSQLLLWACIVALVVIVVHFAYVTWRIYRATVRPVAAGTALGATALADPAAHRRLAEALAREGRYTEALAHRFVALVLDLERARALRYHPSKTPAEYVGEVRLDEMGRATFAGLVARLYRHVFGAAPCDEPAYLEFGAAADGLREHVVPN
ncbi:MAG TPA: DUF4129 domain-containing protein [Gemmatimonadales bacterium]